MLWNICDYTSYWSDPVVRSAGNAHNIAWADCEFEYTGDPDGTTFNIWWDARQGGGNIYDLTWKRCTFGVKNSSGAYRLRADGHADPAVAAGTCARWSAASRPRSTPAASARRGYDFDFSQVTHGSGRAAVGGADGYGFRIWDSAFVGPASVHEHRHLRLRQGVGDGHLQAAEPTDVTPAMRAAAPDRDDDQGRGPAQRVDGEASSSASTGEG